MARADRRRLLEDTLTRQGLGPDVARTVRLAGQAMREQTLRHRIEYALVPDAETGDPVGEPLAGSADEVDTDALFRRMVPGKRYVALHTHPDNGMIEW